ncbi:MAG TPA: hypothetical protein VF033_11910 [Steroidobacteraceae bacterium]
MALRCKSSKSRAALMALLVAACAPAFAEEASIPVCPAVPASSRPPTDNVRLVTGAPYSAMGTSETITTSADGNRVVRQNTVRVWRDSDGRTRSEFELTSIGGPTPVEINSRLTVIDDPAARERYVMRPDGQVVVVPIAPCRPATEPDVTVGPPRPAGLPLKVSRPVKLGERRVDGEIVTGSRVEATIPAGAMGNERPVKMSAEQWYGKDLQVVVEATYKDPRTGETKYRLREIQRDEPDARLFRPDAAGTGGSGPRPTRPADPRAPR